MNFRDKKLFYFLKRRIYVVIRAKEEEAAVCPGLSSLCLRKNERH